jgi:hypothetical protein
MEEIEVKTADCGCDVGEDSPCVECNDCEQCCTCYTCSNCSTTYEHDSGVVECEKCHTCRGGGECCCECSYCESCNTLTEDWCSFCETCEMCCDHIVCRCGTNYNSEHSSICENCERVDDCCCECSYCESCDSRTHNWCGDCETCNECCGCNGTCKEIGYRQHPVQFWNAERDQFQRNKLKRYISAEIEVDQAQRGSDFNTLKAALDKWQDSVVEDGSLHEWPAFEINTQPTNGDLYLKHIDDLCDGLRLIGADTTKACGLHVHVDSRDITYYDLRKVAILYDRAEAALFQLCAPRRLNNNYSLICGYQFVAPYKEPKMWKRHIYGSVYGQIHGQIILPKNGRKAVHHERRDKYGTQRYRALNLHSFFYRGTIEFRHHEGTVDAEEIKNWSLTVAHLIEAAATMTEPQVEALPTSGRELLKAITPSRLHRWLDAKFYVHDTDERYLRDIQNIWSSIAERRTAWNEERDNKLKQYDAQEHERKLAKLRKERVERMRRRFEQRLVEVQSVGIEAIPAIPELTPDIFNSERGEFCAICNEYH